VSDLIAARRDLAVELGAATVFDGGSQYLADEVAEWTAGDGPGVVIDATGVGSVIRQAVELVAPSGRIGILGVSTGEVRLPILAFTNKELSIVGSRNNTGLFAAAVELVERRADVVRRLVTDRFPFADTAAAFERAINHPSEAEKVHIEVGE
jgi:threonine dehydrogenase-like Zn-dependent dehydrogenase